jgi:hypothetical protein
MKIHKSKTSTSSTSTSQWLGTIPKVDANGLVPVAVTLTLEPSILGRIIIVCSKFGERPEDVLSWTLNNGKDIVEDVADIATQEQWDAFLAGH